MWILPLKERIKVLLKSTKIESSADMSICILICISAYDKSALTAWFGTASWQKTRGQKNEQGKFQKCHKRYLKDLRLYKGYFHWNNRCLGVTMVWFTALKFEFYKLFWRQCVICIKSVKNRYKLFKDQILAVPI